MKQSAILDKCLFLCDGNSRERDNYIVKISCAIVNITGKGITFSRHLKQVFNPYPATGSHDKITSLVFHQNRLPNELKTFRSTASPFNPNLSLSLRSKHTADS